MPLAAALHMASWLDLSPHLAPAIALKAASVAVKGRNRPPSRPVRRSVPQLSLLGGFALRLDRGEVHLPSTAQRLLALLALNEGSLPRAYVAGVLRPDVSERHAGASLRSSVWRLGLSGQRLIDGSRTHIRLAPEVEVDWRVLSASYRLLVDKTAELPPQFLASVPISGELLTGWYDEWVIIERERFRQLRLHAMEALCVRLTAVDRPWLAVEAGLAAVAAEPLRESAHRALIAAHLAEGNRSEALRQFELYRGLVREELGIEPSQLMTSLLSNVTKG